MLVSLSNFASASAKRSNQLDALVLDLDLSLTTAELDALFNPTYAAGDFNKMAALTATISLSGRLVMARSGAASHLDGDANEDGNVDGTDFLIWQRGIHAGHTAYFAEHRRYRNPRG